EVDGEMRRFAETVALAGMTADDARAGYAALTTKRAQGEAPMCDAAAPEKAPDLIFTRNEPGGPRTEGWRNRVAQVVQKILVGPGGKGTPVQDRAQIVWREGAIEFPWLRD